MKNYYCILILLCMVIIPDTYCQDIIIKKQKGYTYIRPSLLDSLKINEPDWNAIEIEIRILYFSPEVADTKNHRLTILQKGVDEIWIGKSYTFYYYNEIHYDYQNLCIKNISFNNSWKNSLSEIINKDYLNLKTESDIQIKECNDYVRVYSGGDNYVIQVLKKDRSRIIAFSNPSQKYLYYKDECGKEINYYKKVMRFINILNHEFNIKIHDIE